MYELMVIYQAEILFYKDSMKKFKGKNNLIYQIASAKVETYQRVIDDMKEYFPK